MKENFQNKYNTLLWRVAAVLFSLLMVVIFFVRSFVLGSGFRDLDIITIPIFIVLSAGALVSMRSSARSNGTMLSPESALAPDLSRR